MWTYVIIYMYIYVERERLTMGKKEGGREGGRETERERQSS